MEDLPGVDERIAGGEFGGNGLSLEVVDLKFGPPLATRNSPSRTKFLGYFLKSNHGADGHLWCVRPGGFHMLEPIVGVAV